jgi:DNA-binding response OmpR family regulator
MSGDSGIQVLVVSSDPDRVEQVRSALDRVMSEAPGELHGDWKLHVASSAAQARRALGSETLSLVVVELSPENPGEEILTLDLLLGSTGGSLPPVVVLPRSDLPADARERLLARVEEVLGHPLDEEELIHALTLRLRQTAPGAAGTERREESKAPATHTILVVEDDPVTTELLRHRLTREGYRVRHFGDGLDAWEEVAETPFSLALLDVKLPGMDGLELLERLRNRPAWARVPIVMITGVAGSKEVVRAFELGASDYVVKPFSPPEVVARIRRLLA